MSGFLAIGICSGSVLGCSRYDFGLAHERWLCRISHAGENALWEFISNQPAGNEVRWVRVDDVPVNPGASQMLKIGTAWTWTVGSFSNPLPHPPHERHELRMSMERSTGLISVHKIDPGTNQRLDSFSGSCEMKRVDSPYP